MSRREYRHRQTAISFKKWLKSNSNTSIKRQVEMFNAIADADYAYARQKKSVLVPVKKVKT